MLPVPGVLRKHAPERYQPVRSSSMAGVSALHSPTHTYTTLPNPSYGGLIGGSHWNHLLPLLFAGPVWCTLKLFSSCEENMASSGAEYDRPHPRKKPRVNWAPFVKRYLSVVPLLSLERGTEVFSFSHSTAPIFSQRDAWGVWVQYWTLRSEYIAGLRSDHDTRLNTNKIRLSLCAYVSSCYWGVFNTNPIHSEDGKK